MNVVYIVYGSDEYECPFDPIKAFASREAAVALIDAIAGYKAAQPRCPDNGASDEEWDRYTAAYDAWRLTAPAEDGTQRDSHDILEMEVSR